MTSQALLTEATRLGIELYPDGHTIRYRGPKTALAILKPEFAAHKGELLTLLQAQRDEVETDFADGRSRNHLPKTDHPGYSILATCQRHGVAMRLDSATGDLVIGKANACADESSHPWPSLIRALEAHLDKLVALVEAGWTPKAQFPEDAAA